MICINPIRHLLIQNKKRKQISSSDDKFVDQCSTERKTTGNRYFVYFLLHICVTLSLFFLTEEKMMMQKKKNKKLKELNTSQKSLAFLRRTFYLILILGSLTSAVCLRAIYILMLTIEIFSSFSFFSCLILYVNNNYVSSI